MLGRLSAAAATTALGAAQVTNLTSDSDSESETSSFTERYLSDFNSIHFSLSSLYLYPLSPSLERIDTKVK